VRQTNAKCFVSIGGFELYDNLIANPPLGRSSAILFNTLIKWAWPTNHRLHRQTSAAPLQKN
jgi:hypothetical protein